VAGGDLERRDVVEVTRPPFQRLTAKLHFD